MANKKRKIALPTIDIIYWDDHGEEEKIIKVRPVSLDKLEEVQKLQEQLIQKYVDNDGCLGTLLIDKSVKNTMTQLAKILPVIGESKPGFEIESLYQSGDMVQLGQIFFSESISENMKSEGIKVDKITERPIYHFPEHRYNPTPSAIARIHDLPFFDHYQQMRDKKIEIQLQAQAQKELNHQEVTTVT